MKRTYLIITALFGTSCMLNAQQTTGVIADNLKIERNGEYMVVDMNMNLSWSLVRDRYRPPLFLKFLFKSFKVTLILFYFINKNGHKTFHFMTALLSNFRIKLALNLTLCVH